MCDYVGFGQRCKLPGKYRLIYRGPLNLNIEITPANSTYCAKHAQRLANPDYVVERVESQEVLIANCIGRTDKARAYETAQFRANLTQLSVWVYYQAGKWYTTSRFLDIRIPCDHQKQFDPEPISTPA